LSLPTVLNDDLISSGLLHTSAERRLLTVVFCDLVGSTALSIRLDPEDLREIFTVYQREATSIVVSNGGLVARYQGDGILAYFGHPAASEHDAERGIAAALYLREMVRNLPGTEKLRARIGIATGVVIAGELHPSPVADNPAVVGAIPNLAARLQAAAKPDSIFISESTKRLAGDLFYYRDLGSLTLAGFNEPVRAWEVLGSSGAQNRFEALHFERTVFVGREEQLEFLLLQWNQVKTRVGQVIMLSGEPGFGKSRLVAEFRRMISNESPTLMEYFCSPHHEDSVLYPFITGLHRAANLEQSDTPNAKLDKLEAFLARNKRRTKHEAALFADLIGVPTGKRYPVLSDKGLTKRESLFAAMVKHLQALARRGPVLMIVEDVHWIDPSSAELLNRVANRIANLPVLLVVTSRAAVRLAWGKNSKVTLLPLAPLDGPQLQKLVIQTAASAILPTEIMARIVENAGGNPLFAEELTKAFLESGAVQDLGYGSAVEGPLSKLSIPATLQASISARLDRLGFPKRVAQIGSVLGRQFSYALVAAVTEAHGQALIDALNELVRSGLFVREQSGTIELFTFKHALFQDVAYMTLLRSERKSLHLRVATVFEREAEKHPEITLDVIAQHYSRADAHWEAVSHWKQAAEHALARSGHEEAVGLLEKALKSLTFLVHQPNHLLLKLDLATKLAVAYRSIRGYGAPGVEHRYLDALALCSEAGDTKQRFENEWGLMQCYIVQEKLDQADVVARRLLDYSNHDPSMLIDAYLANGMVKFALGEFMCSRVYLERGLVLTQSESDTPHVFTHGQNPGCFLRSYLAYTLWYLGAAERAIEAVELNLTVVRSRASEPSHAHSYVNALTFAARVFQLCKRVQDVKQVSEELLQISRRNHYAYYEALARIQQGWALAMSHSSALGIQKMLDGLRTLEETGSFYSLRGYFVQLADLYARNGDNAAAMGALSRATMGDRRARIWDAEIERLKGEILASGDIANPTAEDSFRSALRIAREQHARSFELRIISSYARYLRRVGRRSEATALIADAQAARDGCTAVNNYHKNAAPSQCSEGSSRKRSG